MAQEDVKPEATAETSAREVQPAKKTNFVKKLAILGFIVSVIGLECGVAAFFMRSIGSAAETGGAAESKPEEKSAKHEKKAEGKHGEREAEGAKDPADQVEVVLGEFSVTSYQPATNNTLRIEFNLYGTVDSKDQKEFMTALEENLHRFRDQVLLIVRSAETTDLTDAGLGLVKRKILEKTNRMIGKPLLRSVIFSDFSFIEQ
jgi:flagellar basal body-associated protein FliL